MPPIKSMQLGPDGQEVGKVERAAAMKAKLHVPYTPAMIDEAAAAVLEPLPLSEAAMMHEMWSRDPNVPAAALLMRSQAQARQGSAFTRVGKIKHTVRAVMEPDVPRELQRLYGEFDLSFESTQHHDHEVGAVARALDFKLLKRNKPPGMPYKDIGGSVMSHVEAGDTDCVVVVPVMDNKDPVRRTLWNMRLRKLAEGKLTSDAAVVGGAKSVEMARSVLAGEGKYLVEKRAQDDSTPAKFAIACHVYDIPLADWPQIMEQGGTLVVDGCLHFSNDLMENVQGVMGFVRQRFRIDAEADIIQMGFENSSAPWYEHRWSEYMRYGVDQVLHSAKGSYSYKIVARKGDTIYWRIMQIDSKARFDSHQYYDMPGIGVVEVDGFDLEATQKSSRMVRKTYTFPQSLWERMVRDAVQDVMKFGRPDVNMLVSTYRVATVNSSFNGVNPMPTARVATGDVMSMVVHAGLAGYAEVMLVDMQTEEMLRAQGRVRERQTESTLYKAFATFLTATVGLVTLPFYPIKQLLDKLDDKARAKLAEFLVTWRPVARVKQFKANMFLNLRDPDVHYVPNGETVYRQHMRDRLLVDQMFALASDAEVSQDILRVCGDGLPSNLREAYERGVARARTDEQNSAASVTAPPSYRTEPAPVVREAALARFVSEGKGRAVVETPVSAQRTEVRLAAIREAIAEVHATTRKVKSSMQSVWASKAPGGEPSEFRFRQSPDKSRNPDAWYVKNGVLAGPDDRSLLGSREFTYSAVWLPQPLRNGLQLVSVTEQFFDGNDVRTGEPVSRRYFEVGDSSYSGWAMVCDDTVVFNGPNILAALEAALLVSHDYTIVVNQGGAGAGKTTSIVSSYQEGEMVICPVRASTDDTRERLKDKVKDVRTRRLLIRTMDSVLANWDRPGGKTRELRASVLHGDEAFMTRFGYWCAAAGLLGVEVLSAHGDKEQIPYVPRVDVADQYLALQPDYEVTTFEVYRCAPSIMAVWAGVYDYRLRTPVSDEGAVVSVVSSVDQYKVPSEGTVAVIVMYQAEKLEMKKALAQQLRMPGNEKRITILTAHESEGKTFDHALLVNTETRVRGEQDSYYLWVKKAYVLVAASRARRSLVYAKYGKENDLLLKWIAAARDPRRVKAVTVMETAGESVEFA